MLLIVKDKGASVLDAWFVEKIKNTVFVEDNALWAELKSGQMYKVCEDVNMYEWMVTER